MNLPITTIEPCPSRRRYRTVSARITCLALLVVMTPLNLNAMNPTKPVSTPLELATLGGGCFWCLEAAFERYAGVAKVISGYAGGQTPDPTYKQVCSGTTGHAEVVQISFDPAVITFDQLLDIFWEIHDPTSLNRQGADLGTQYRSIVLTHNPQQEAAARKSMAAARGRFRDPLVTEVVPLSTFYPAEAEHQDFYRRNPSYPYCVAVVSPKLKKLEKAIPATRTDSIGGLKSPTNGSTPLSSRPPHAE